MRRDHKKAALGLGDLDLPGAVLSQAHGRDLFFRAIEDWAPRVLESLPPLGTDPRPALAKCHLVDEWQVDVAERTQQMRVACPGHFTKKWCLTHVPAIWIDSLDDDCVSPVEMTACEYLDAPAADVGRVRGRGRAFFERQTQALRAAGYSEPIRKHRHHFEWAARFQLRAESYSRISRESDNSRSASPATVRDAVVDLAEFVGLTLRRPERGGRQHVKGANRRPSRAFPWYVETRYDRDDD